MQEFSYIFIEMADVHFVREAVGMVARSSSQFLSFKILLSKGILGNYSVCHFRGQCINTSRLEGGIVMGTEKLMLLFV